MSTREEVFGTFSRLIGVDKDLLTETTIIADVVPDSLKYFELFLELEKGMGKKLSFEEVVAITTLGDVIDFINKEQHATDSKK